MEVLYQKEPELRNKMVINGRLVLSSNRVVDADVLLQLSKFCQVQCCKSAKTGIVLAPNGENLC